MFVRLLVGPRKGEIVDMKFADAKPLLDDGRAERETFEPRSEVKKPAEPEMGKAKKKLKARIAG